MKTRTLALLLALSPLAACGYDLQYKGQVTDDTGVARQGLDVTIRGVDFAPGRSTAPDTIARTQVLQAATTDASGNFEMTQHVDGGFGFGCGVDDGGVAAVVIAPDGPMGAVLVKHQFANDKNQIDIGTVRFPGPLNAAVDPEGVLVALPRNRGTASLIHVDDAAWFAGDDGILPPAALKSCGKAATCDHTVSLSWMDGDAELRTEVKTFNSASPTPAFLGVIGTSGVEASFTKPVQVDQIVVDGLFAESDIANLDQLGFPAISTAPYAMPVGACKVYGTGITCQGPKQAISEISMTSPAQSALLRVYGR